MASKPWGLDKLLGARAYYSLHALAALVGLAAALTHFLIKSVVLGVQPGPLTAPGAFADLLFQFSVIFAFFFLSAPILPQVKWLANLRAWAAKHWGWTHNRLRVVHNLTVLAVVLIVVHVLVAPTTQHSWYAWGFMALWGVGCLVAYLRYRVRGRR